jgi:hypothetical protein
MTKRLSPHQHDALHWMSKKALGYSVAGFCSDLRPGQYWSSATILSLEVRRHCTIVGTGLKRIARITASGRRELAGAITGRLKS